MHYRKRQTKSKSRRSRNKKGGLLDALLPPPVIGQAPGQVPGQVQAPGQGQAQAPGQAQTSALKKEEEEGLWSKVTSFFGSKDPAPAAVAGGRRKKTKTKTKKYKK